MKSYSDEAIWSGSTLFDTDWQYTAVKQSDWLYTIADCRPELVGYIDLPVYTYENYVFWTFEAQNLKQIPKSTFLSGNY